VPVIGLAVRWWDAGEGSSGSSKNIFIYRFAYFHFIPGQMTFAYTAPPTRLLANGENMTHHHNLAQARTEAIWLTVNVNK